MKGKHFDYETLPYDEVGQLYRKGWGWKAIATHFGAPDHKTLARHALRRLPDLEARDHAQAQRARRSRELVSGRRPERRPWWKGE